jgi:hypothetical protein
LNANKGLNQEFSIRDPPIFFCAACVRFRCSLRLSVSEEHIMGLFMSVCRIFHHIVTTLTLNQIVATLTFETFVAFDILLVALMTLSPVMWRKEPFGILCT